MSDTLCVVGTPLNATNNSSSENITYSITPVIALNQLNLTSADNAFRQEVLEYNHDIRFLPNETVDAVRNLMASAVAGWGYMVIDALIGLHVVNTSIAFADLLAEAIRGFIEYEGTNLRMYYTANQVPGLKDVSDNYTVWRIGYEGHHSELMTVLPQLLVVLLMAAFCVYYGMASGSKIVGSFVPTDSTCLITASAIGAARDKLKLPVMRHNISSDSRLGSAEIRYDNVNGLVTVQKDVSNDGAVLLTSIVTS